MATCTFTLIDVDTENCPDNLKHLCNDDGLIIECVATARMVRSDYGVPGSPVWYEPEVEGIEFEINGEVVSKVSDEVYEMAHDEAVEMGEWE